MRKPTSAKGYSSDQHAVVTATCLHLATKLGDLLDDIVVVGGLAPTLLVDPASLPESESRHVGTMDLDIGLGLAILDDERYADLVDRLWSAGFEPDKSDAGNTVRQRWRGTEGPSITVDFLIPPSSATSIPGRLQDVSPDFAAVITPGLDLAFEDKREGRLKSRTLDGATAHRSLFVCGPAAFIVLKLLAFRNRGENKDAYDLFFVLRNHPDSPTGIGTQFAEWANHSAVQEAMGVLRDDFLQVDGLGPVRVARFLYERFDEPTQGDVVAYCSELVEAYDRFGAG